MRFGKVDFNDTIRAILCKVMYFHFSYAKVLYYVSSGSKGLYITFKEQWSKDYCIVMRNGVCRECNSSIPMVIQNIDLHVSHHQLMTSTLLR